MVAQQQVMLNKSAVVTEGEFISATGDQATVVLDGEEVARTVPLSSIVASDSAIGNLSRPGEMPVIDMSPRKGVY